MSIGGRSAQGLANERPLIFCPYVGVMLWSSGRVIRRESPFDEEHRDQLRA